MKFTQKTLFQCFEKVRSTPTSTVESKTKDVPLVSEKFVNTTDFDQETFLLPIHVRQLNSTLSTDEQSFTWKCRENENEPFEKSTDEFSRLRDDDVDEISTDFESFKFVEIDSNERREELFQRYTKDQSWVNWRMIFNYLQDYRKKTIEQNQYEQSLWTEIYRPKSSRAYLGNHTRQVKRLNEWFIHWSSKLLTEPVKKCNSGKRKRDSDDDEDSNFSESSSNLDNPENPRLVFVHGTGTTCLVHALAEEYNFKVTEINGSQCRARAPLLKQLEQVTSHHQLSFKRCPSDPINSQDEKSNVSSSLPAKKKLKSDSNSINSYFKGKNHSNQRNEEKENFPQTISTKKKQRRSKSKTVEPNLFSSVQVEKTSLILFDEIETLTDDDHFWSCLKKLLETAKKPIILTSNSRTNPEKAIIHLSKLGFYELIHLEAHDFELIETFLQLVLLSENLEIFPENALKTLIERYSGDIRRILIELQYLSQSEKSEKLVCSKSKLTVDQGQWHSSSVFDAIFYSRLNEQWSSSSLKPLFDQLTRDYTDKYNRTHQTLVEAHENNEQRIELFDTFKLFMQEQELVNIRENPSFYLDYRPFVREICRNEKRKIIDNQRFQHALHFRSCSLELSDFDILSTGLDR